MFTNKKNRLVVGRGSVAIYLALLCESVQGKKVLLPANICYAAVFPVLLSGNRPVFCDVQADTGNVGLENLQAAWEDGIFAVILPHMYGNPIAELSKIVKYCHDKDAIVIEDCASALGARTDEGLAGDAGDYAVFSFGYSKTVSVGNGGMLVSDRSLARAKALYDELPLYDVSVGQDCAFFSKLYRAIRNDPRQAWSEVIYRGLAQKAERLFLYRVDRNTEEEIASAVKDHASVVAKRKEQVHLYSDLLSFGEGLRPYRFSEEASPWRFNVLVAPTVRGRLIAFLLEKNIPVSDWYPRVTDIFFDDGRYPNTEIMESSILNFPLLIPEQEIKRICDTINCFFKETV